MTIHRQVGVEVQANARVVGQHLESDAVLAADGLLVRIDANGQRVVEQVIVRTVTVVSAAQLRLAGRLGGLFGRRRRLSRSLI